MPPKPPKASVTSANTFISACALSHRQLVGPAARPWTFRDRELRHLPPTLQAVVTLQPIIDGYAETGLCTFDNRVRQRPARARREQAFTRVPAQRHHRWGNLLQQP